LREAGAVIGVLVGDEDGIDTIKIAFDSGKARERFAFSEAGVYEDAGAFGFEQREIARTAGSEDGDAQTDGNAPKKPGQANLASKANF
jgi:hypothetical protein